MAMKIRFRFDGRCESHPRYNPKIDGAGGIKGGCKTCDKLWRLYSQMEHAENLAWAITDDAVRTKQFLEGRHTIESRNGETVRR